MKINNEIQSYIDTKRRFAIDPHKFLELLIKTSEAETTIEKVISPFRGGDTVLIRTVGVWFFKNLFYIENKIPTLDSIGKVFFGIKRIKQKNGKVKTVAGFEINKNHSTILASLRRHENYVYINDFEYKEMFEFASNLFLTMAENSIVDISETFSEIESTFTTQKEKDLIRFIVKNVSISNTLDKWLKEDIKVKETVKKEETIEQFTATENV